MQRFRKIMVCVLLIISVLVVSGCAQFDMNLRIHANQSADLNFVLLVNKAALTFKDGQVQLDSIKNEAKSQGFSAEDVKQGSMIGFKFAKHFSSFDDLAKGNISGQDTTSKKSDQSQPKNSASSHANIGIFKKTFNVNQNNLYSVKSGFFRDIYTIKANLNLADLAGDNLSFGSPMDSLTQSFVQNMIADIDFNFNLQLPVKAISSNASKVSANGKDLTWSFKLGDTKAIKLSFSMWHIGHLLLVIVPIVFLLLLFIVLLVKRNQKKKKERAKHPGNEQEAVEAVNVDDDVFSYEDQESGDESALPKKDLKESVDVFGESMEQPVQNSDDTKNANEENTRKNDEGNPLL